MKRYLLFAYDRYYPSGGMNDFVGDFDTLDELKIAAKNKDVKYYDYIKYLDTETGEQGTIKDS
jgi:hypothetical protein